MWAVLRFVSVVISRKWQQKNRWPYKDPRPWHQTKSVFTGKDASSRGKGSQLSEGHVGSPHVKGGVVLENRYSSYDSMFSNCLCFRNGLKIWLDISPEKDMQLTTGAWKKNVQCRQSSEKCESKPHEMPPHTCQDGYFQKKKNKRLVLSGMWKNLGHAHLRWECNMLQPLVGQWEALPKFKHGNTIGFSQSNSRHLCKKKKKLVEIKI